MFSFFNLHQDSDTIMAIHFAMCALFALVAGLFAFLNSSSPNLRNRLGSLLLFGLGLVLVSIGLFHAHLTIEFDYLGATLAGAGMGTCRYSSFRFGNLHELPSALNWISFCLRT